MDSVLCDDIEWIRTTSTDDLFDIYNTELTTTLDRHAPRYVRHRKPRILTPWFDDECRQMKRRVRVLERKYRKTHDPSDRQTWVLKLKEQAIFYQNKESFYWSTRINANAHNARRLWSDLDMLMRRDNGNNNCSHTTPIDATKQADAFLKLFDNKVASVRSETENAQTPSFRLVSDGVKLEKFQHTTPLQIVSLLNASCNKLFSGSYSYKHIKTMC